MKKVGIGYCRVSTPKQAQRGESLEDQEQDCIFVAAKVGATLEKVFAEPFSGRVDHRPVYDEMISYIKQNSGRVDYLFVRGIGRLTRGGSYAYESLKVALAKLGVEIVDYTGIIQPSRNTMEQLGMEYDWSRYSPSAMTEALVAGQKNDEVRDMLTRLIGQEVKLTRRGYRVRPPNDGYTNDKIFVEGKKRTIQVPDPKRAQYFITMFEERAKENVSDQEIVDMINAMGFKSRERKKWDKAKRNIIGKIGGNPLTVKRMQILIKNPAYCGVVCETWTNNQPVRSQSEGLISIDTFNKANKGKVFIKELDDGGLKILYNQLHNRQIERRNKNNPLYPYKFIRCDLCNKPYKGSAPKGKLGKRYPTYHCSRGHGYIGIKKTDFEESIKSYISNIEPSDEFLKSLDRSLLKVYRRRQKDLAHVSSQIDVNVSELKKRKEQALETLLESSSNVVRKELETRIEKLDADITQAQEKREKIEVSEYDISAFINHVKFFVEHLDKLLLDNSNMARQQALFTLVFDEMPSYQEVNSGTPKLSLMFETKRTHRIDESLMVTPGGV
ncbi:recombinase family protein, partial [Candidatus Uhrbacteria bacterium]|nr:recombinase family protein [Candidatus Uhrbacteria bacterium]